MQQLILGTGTAIWWLTEPHSNDQFWTRLVHFIKREEQLYSDKRTSLMQNRFLKSEAQISF
jgi:hypothetical protein